MLPPPDPRMQANPHPTDQVLRIESTTWNRDSHELFDYESRHVFIKQFLLRKASRVFRHQLDVSVIPEGRELPTGTDYLLSVRSREGRYFVYPADRASCLGGSNIQHRKLWLIIKHLQDGRYPLLEGDIIKLGRFKLRVKQLVLDDNPGQVVDFKLDDVEVPASDLSNEESRTQQCRICLLEGNNEEDPLVRACQCKGSIMYIHLGCLQHWVNSRLNLNDDPARSCCFIRQLQCELCKSPFPSSVNHRGVRYNVVKVPNVAPPFIVLENQVGPANKGVHLCSMAVKKECKLGRGHESDVRIADVSISRFHAMIRFEDGQFMLEDHTSKFGTLVALRRPVQVENELLAVQVGRTVLHLSLSPISTSDIQEDVVEITQPAAEQPVEGHIDERSAEGQESNSAPYIQVPQQGSNIPAQGQNHQGARLQVLSPPIHHPNHNSNPVPQFQGGEGRQFYGYGQQGSSATEIPPHMLGVLRLLGSTSSDATSGIMHDNTPIATINGDASSSPRSYASLSQPLISNLSQALQTLHLDSFRRQEAMAALLRTGVPAASPEEASGGRSDCGATSADPRQQLLFVLSRHLEMMKQAGGASSRLTEEGADSGE